ncbi:ABC transporter permease [Chitinophaga lutea]
MWKNYLKVTWRNLTNNKAFGLINIAGLTIGIAACMFILLWVANEYSFNRLHKNQSRIYQVMENQAYDGSDMLTTSATPGPLADKMKEEVPGIAAAASVSWKLDALFSAGDKHIKAEGQHANPDMFRVFTLPFVEGDAAQALKRPTDLILTESLAHSLFGDEPALGKTVRIDNKEDFQVSGVVRDNPGNSLFKFKWLRPMEALVKQHRWLKNWTANAPRTYLLLDEKADPAQVAAKSKFIIRKQEKDARAELFIQPFSDVYLKGKYEDGKLVGGRIEYVWLFIIVAIFVLLIACINFMNLATAKAIHRSKEVGVRKSIGAGRGSLVRQFLGESLALTLISTILALVLVWLLLPAFERMVNVSLSVRLFTWYNMVALLALGIVTGVAAGIYPAFYLSALDPLASLKGGVLRLRSNALWLRKGLVVFQFVISTALILGAVLVNQQVQYIKNRNIGLNKDQVVYLRNEGNIAADPQPFRNALNGLPGIVSVSLSDQLPVDIGNNGQGVSWPGKDPKSNVLFAKLWVGNDFGKTMQLQMVEGRTFSAEYPGDAKTVVINEMAARVMRLKKPYVGQVISVDGEQRSIIGVSTDFATNHASQKAEPLVIQLQEAENQYLLVRVQPQHMDEALASIGQAYKQFNPEYPLQVQYLDVYFADMYKSEQVIGRLSAAFMMLAIFIACLGLFGLAAFTAQQRTKEIGIRKVLGASVTQILLLLSREFLRLVLLAVIIAVPLSAYFMHGWLAKFVYRIDMAWWVFAATAFGAVAIALLTVSFQSIREAMSDPVKSLKSE